MKDYKTVQGIVRICGDYCAWHETSLVVDYIFGDHPIQYDIFESIRDFNSDNKPKDELDEAARKYVENYNGDYCDYGIRTILLEYEDGNITNKWIAI